MADPPTSAGECQVCGHHAEKRYGGLGRYVAMCGDCWNAIDEVRLTAAEAALVHKMIMFLDAEDVPEFSEAEIETIWALHPRLEPFAREASERTAETFIGEHMPDHLDEGTGSR